MRLLVAMNYDARFEETAAILNSVFNAMKTLSYLEFQKWIKENAIIERIDLTLQRR